MRMDDISVPRTQAARAAAELAASCYSPALLNHVVRSWLWAEAFALLEDRRDVDHELLHTSALLHDLGLVPAYDNATLSYEEAGGHVAVALTAGAGWAPERRRRALEVIVRHNWPAVDPGTDLEGYLLEVATALDISGARTDALPQDFVREVLATYPRLTLAEEFTAQVTDQATRKPTTAAHRIVQGGVAAKLARHPFEGAPGVVVRTYRSPDDAAGTHAVFHAAITRTASADYEPAQIAAWAGPEHPDLDPWDARRAAAHTFVAVTGDQVVGFADFLDDGLLDMLFVHPEAGGRGVARRLVGTVEQEARSAGLAALRTHASRTARPAFERFGFRVVAARPDNVVNGQVVPNFEMRRDLQPGPTTASAELG